MMFKRDELAIAILQYQHLAFIYSQGSVVATSTAIT